MENFQMYFETRFIRTETPDFGKRIISKNDKQILKKFSRKKNQNPIYDFESIYELQSQIMNYIYEK